jgi:hypothetical protein
MKRVLLIVASGALLALPAAAAEWKNVPVVDTLCIDRVKADPDAHTTECALKCEKGGYGLIADGAYLKFDAAGNQKVVAALNATKKTDHLRANVTGDKDGDTIKVKTFTLQ